MQGRRLLLSHLRMSSCIKITVDCSITDSSNSQSGNNVGAVAGGVIVAVVFIITTAVTVIVIVFLVLRRNHRGNYSISAGAQKYREAA